MGRFSKSACGLRYGNGRFPLWQLLSAYVIGRGESGVGEDDAVLAEVADAL